VTILQSLQGKLIVASVVLVVVVLALAGAIFVNVRRGEQRQQELDHAIVNATPIQNQFLLRQVSGVSLPDLTDFVNGRLIRTTSELWWSILTGK